MADMPRLVKPIWPACATSSRPTRRTTGWELKWDGTARGGLCQRRRRVRLVSRNEKEMAGKLPELARAGRARRSPGHPGRRECGAARRAVPTSGCCRSRMHVLRPDDTLVADVPVHYYVFDVLYQGQDVLIGRPYTERRPGWRISAWTRARSALRRGIPRRGATRCWPRASPKGWREWWASPLSSGPTIPASGGDWIKDQERSKQQEGESSVAGAPGEGLAAPI